MTQSLFGGGPRESAKSRARSIKAKLPVPELAKALGYPSGEGPGGMAFCTCPACKTEMSARIAKNAQSWRCTSRGCGAEGDVISFQMLSTGMDFASACDDLEQRHLTSPRDHDTADLFAGRPS